jgi:hypothetical protein
MDFFVEGRFKAERAKSQMLNGFQDFGVSFQQDFFVSPVEVGDYFCVTFQPGGFLGNSANIYLQVEAGGTHAIIQKFLQSCGGCGAVQLAIVD